MKIIFFGTPYYTLPILEMLHKTFRMPNEDSPIVAVVTQPPRATGRKKIMTFSPIDEWAHKKGITKYHKAADALKTEADIAILASYGEFIPDDVIKHFKYGILNVHPSLLPNFRGASPVQATIATGSEPGATIIKLDNLMDHGPILAQFKTETKENETTQELRDRLFLQSSEVLKTLIPAYIAGKVKLKAQEHDRATFTSLLTKDHGYIPWEHIKRAMEGKESSEEWKIPFVKDLTTNEASQSSQLPAHNPLHYSPETIYRYFLALTPWPGIWTLLRSKASEGQATSVTGDKEPETSEKRLKILGAHLESIPTTDNETPTTNFVIDTVQLEGKNPVSWKQFRESHEIS